MRASWHNASPATPRDRSTRGPQDRATGQAVGRGQACDIRSAPLITSRTSRKLGQQARRNRPRAIHNHLNPRSKICQSPIITCICIGFSNQCGIRRRLGRATLSFICQASSERAKAKGYRTGESGIPKARLGCCCMNSGHSHCSAPRFAAVPADRRADGAITNAPESRRLTCGKPPGDWNGTGSSRSVHEGGLRGDKKPGIGSPWFVDPIGVRVHHGRTRQRSDRLCRSLRTSCNSLS
jgi:hypothetical protein